MSEPTDRPVVVGIDGDQPALLTYAAELARALGAPLRVVHACADPPLTADLYLGQDVTLVLHDAAQRVLDEAHERLDDRTGQRIDYALRFARPTDAIVAESEDASHVVLGTDDVGWFDRVLGREVARHAAVHASCPVWVVPPGVSTPQVDDIVLALDLDDVSEEALRFAFELGTRVDADLEVVAVLPMDAKDSAPAWRERLWRLVQGWCDRYPDVDVEHRVVIGSAVRELDRATDLGEVVVVGAPRGPRPGSLLGPPVVGSLLRWSQSPVVVVPRARSAAAVPDRG